MERKKVSIISVTKDSLIQLFELTLSHKKQKQLLGLIASKEIPNSKLYPYLYKHTRMGSYMTRLGDYIRNKLRSEELKLFTAQPDDDNYVKTRLQDSIRVSER